jgi:signal transduction histidine kinase
MTEAVAQLPIERAEDVFALRQAGRAALAALGCDDADQVRFVTALSELGREALAGGATATFSLEDESLVVEIAHFPREGAAAGSHGVGGLAAARRLVGDLTVHDGESPNVVTVRLAHRSARSTRVAPKALRTAIVRTAAPHPLDELRLENRDLIATLERLEAKQGELVRLNAELEETNRGVMAMYGQLSDELEETNRGVVALYAELDDKTVQLNDANNAKSRFLANVSHELRGPVNSVLALTRLLLDPASETVTEDQRKQLTLVRGAASELLRLVNDLLDLAKAESGRLDPDVTDVDLAAIFSELRGSLRPLARPGVTLHVDPPDVPVLESDATLLRQVLRNLLTNALKFTPRGSVRLRAVAVEEHSVELRVSDTGIGIGPADHARIFEEFYQVRGPLQAEQKGTGLGLPYARRVTQTLGGQLRLESEPERGSTFIVTLPLRWQALLAAKRSPARRAHASIVGTVLIVDDDAGFRTALRGMLQDDAVNVLEARGGAEGLDLMRTAKPDLAFLDLRMPDMDGADVLAVMNGDPALRRIPVVIVTSSDLTAARTTLGGAASLIAKANVSRETVQQAIAEARL